MLRAAGVRDKFEGKTGTMRGEGTRLVSGGAGGRERRRSRRNFGEVSFSRLRLTASLIPGAPFRYLSPRDYRTPGEDLDSAPLGLAE